MFTVKNLIVSGIRNDYGCYRPRKCSYIYKTSFFVIAYRSNVTSFLCYCSANSHYRFRTLSLLYWLFVRLVLVFSMPSYTL